MISRWPGPLHRWRLEAKLRLEQFHRLRRNYGGFLQVSEEVQDAIASRKPVIALESTIYTHGLPYPDNLHLAESLETLARTCGVLPATIGILRGKGKVGLSPTEIQELLDPSNREKLMKVSRREIAFVCGAGLAGRSLNGGTTVAGTSLLAHLAGISIFATGGLGGVHWGGENSMDISADLTELGRTPVAVICSGIKSFLDIPRTLEYLETHGVGVATFADGSSPEPADFPAFWSRESGIPSPLTVHSDTEAAGLVLAMKRLSLQSGFLLANPIPRSHSIPKTQIDQMVSQALDEAATKGVRGNESTPFVLSKIRGLSQGRTLKANVKLIEANVVRAAKVAIELQTLDVQAHTPLDVQYERLVCSPSSSLVHELKSSRGQPRARSSSHPRERSLLVAGAIVTDIICKYRPVLEGIEHPRHGTSNPATVGETLGGVGQNIATAAHFCGAGVFLCSSVGDDDAGRSAVRTLRQRGLDVSGIHVSAKLPTAKYVAFNDAHGRLELAMADTAVLEREPSAFSALWKPLIDRTRPKWIALDGNWDCETLQAWINAAKRYAKIAYEPVSVEKAIRVFLHGREIGLPWQLLDLATPNVVELEAMAKAAPCCAAWQAFIRGIDRGSVLRRLHSVLDWPFRNLTPDAPMHALALLPHIRCLLTKAGPDGVLMTEVLGSYDKRLREPSEERHILLRMSRDTSGCSEPQLPAPHEVQWCDDFGGVYMRHFKAPVTLQGRDLVNSNGSGDTFLGILLAGLVSAPDKPVAEFIQIAQAGAALTLRSTESVSPELRNLAAQLSSD